MKIPKSLKIGAHIFEIIETELADCSGATEYTQLTIKLQKGMKKSAKEATLFHEIICHCVNTSFAGESQVAHGFMDSIAEQIYQVLSDNKMLK